MHNINIVRLEQLKLTYNIDNGYIISITVVYSQKIKKINIMKYDLR